MYKEYRILSATDAAGQLKKNDDDCFNVKTAIEKI